jgi:hypothetical protein
MHRLTSDDLEVNRALRRLLSGIWVGPAADHFAGLISSLDRQHLRPLADDLARLSGRLELLSNHAYQAASAESAGMPVSSEPDLRRWPMPLCWPPATI